MSGNRLSPGVLDALLEKIPHLSKRSIQNSLSKIRQAYPGVSLNGAAQLLAQQYGKSIIAKLSTQDRQSIANVSVPKNKETSLGASSNVSTARTSASHRSRILTQTNPFSQLVEGALLTTPVSLLAILLLIILGQASDVLHWLQDLLSKPVERMLGSLYFVAGLWYFYNRFESFSKKQPIHKALSKFLGLLILLLAVLAVNNLLSSI